VEVAITTRRITRRSNARTLNLKVHADMEIHAPMHTETTISEKALLTSNTKDNTWEDINKAMDLDSNLTLMPLGKT
jgi:hypothetical protein